MNKIKIMITSLALLLTGVSCDSLDVAPSTELGEGVTNVQSANAALVGIYDGMQSVDTYGQDILVFGDVRGGDMQPVAATNSRTHPFYTFNNRTPDNGPATLWTRNYSQLNRINNIIAAFVGESPAVTDGTEGERNNILGQAYALRALHHFDVVRLYGVPFAKDNGASLGAMIVDQVYPAGTRLARSTVAETYAIIKSDLEAAVGLLDPDVSISADYGVMNYWATKSLLARVSLYTGDWDTAYSNSVDVIENGPYELISGEDYVDSWSSTYTSESIFSVINTTTDNPTRESMSSLSSPEGYGEIIVSTAFIDLLNENATDVRLELIDKDSAGEDGWYKKYPGQGDFFTNNIPVIRLSEVYLTAAEAALKKSTRDQASANKYLNAIRTRANTPEVVATESNVIDERRKELVHEGHRFFDVMRLGLTVDRTGGRNYLNPSEVPVVSWNENVTVLPIPRTEINGNPDIVNNPGYNN